MTGERQQYRMKPYRRLEPRDTVDQLLTIRPRPVRGVQVHWPGGATVPARRSSCYYAACWPDGSQAATLHPGQGVVLAGHADLWPVARLAGARRLLMPSPRGLESAASLFADNAGLFHRILRVTPGEDVSGGYVMAGKGFRGGMLLRAGDGRRALLLRCQGDPPTAFFLEPVRDGPAPPSVAIALLVAYVLIERETKQSSVAGLRTDGENSSAVEQAGE